MRVIRAYIVWVLLLAGVAFCGAAGAQEERGERDTRDKGRSVYLVCPELPKGVENPVKVLLGKKLKEVVLSRRTASDGIQIPADGKFLLVKPTGDGSGRLEPGEGLQVLARAQIPEGTREAIIVLTPTKKQELLKEGLVFDCYVQDLAKFRRGGSMYINMTSDAIGVELGGSKKNVAPNSALIMDTGVRDKPKNVPVSYWMFHATEKNWRRLSASTVAFYPTRREICFFFRRGNGQIAYQGVTCPVSE